MILTLFSIARILLLKISSCNFELLRLIEDIAFDLTEPVVDQLLSDPFFR